MDFDSRYPIYLQIINKIKREIVLGEIRLGEKLQSVRAMASELQVNVNTVHRVYQELEREGITNTVRGTGSFIVEDEAIKVKIKTEMAEELLNDFVSGMRELGFTNQELINKLEGCIEED